MIRRHTKLIIILLIISLFSGTSIIPAFSIDLKDKTDDLIEDKVDSFVDKRINKTDILSSPWYYDDVMNPNLGYNIKWMREYEDYRDYRERLYERPPEYYNGTWLNHSRYPFNEFGERNDKHTERELHYQWMVENHSDDIPIISTEPTPKPDFAAGKTWYVDDDASFPFLGTKNNPFRKIRVGVLAARDGDTVYVYNGLYQENVLVAKSIILKGEDRNNTVIDGGGHNAHYVILVNFDWVTISGFTIQNGHGDIICYSSDNTINGNTIINSDEGIYLYGSSDNTINGNTIINNDFSGITLDCSFNKPEYSSGNIISGNTISNNGWDGITIYSSSNCNTICDNNITDNNDDGIDVDYSSGNTIKNNIFQSNGIRITGSNIEHWDSHTIENNVANGKPIRYYKNTENIYVPSDTAQVILGNCTGFTIQNLNLSYVDTGIQLGFSSDNNIEGNLGEDSEIVLSGSSDNTIIGNTITHSDVGINLLYSSDRNIVYGNMVTNDGFGIGISDSSDNTIGGNTITNNQWGGIGIGSSSGNIVGWNLVTNNYDGINLIGSDNNNISGNTITNNQWVGIEIDSSSNCNTICENSITDNNYSGIWMYDSSSNIITGNTITNNYFSGIGIDSSSNCNAICENNIINNGDYGITITFSHNNHITENNFITNNINAFFGNSFPTKWSKNYWDDWRGIGPKFISGFILVDLGKIAIPLPWFKCDWHPAKEPYDIE